MSEHIDPAQGLALVALSEDEPELAAAQEHARTCERCCALLAESTMMLQRFDRSARALPSIAPALKLRIAQRTHASVQRGSYFALCALALLSLLLAWKNGHPVDFPSVRPAMRCALFEGGYALAPLLLGVALTRMGKVRLAPARFASYTMGFAVLGQVFLRGHCEAHDLSLHLLIFHFLIVLVAGAVGAGAARLLALRR
ncbi:MAG: hypothetical protein JWN04_4642 [Myxococcaceae bacterium]|nr:hypothetical protein [Myxococcaceae bacterium]